MAINFRPNIEFNIVERTKITSGIPSLILLNIGPASWGPVNLIQDFESYNQIASAYISGRLVDGALAASTGGTGQMRVVRVTDGTEVKANNDLLDAVAVPAIDVDAKYPGTHGNNITVTITTIGSNRAATISDGINTEVFNNIGDGYATNALLIADVNANSQLVTMTALAGGLVANQSITLAGGDDGTPVTAANIATAITAVSTEDWDILITPGVTADADHATILAAVQTRYNDENKGAVFIAGVSTDESLATIKARTTYSADGRFCLIAPGSTKIAGETFDGSYLACAYAGLVTSLAIGISATRKPLPVESITVDSTTNKTTYFASEVNQLLAKGVTPINKIGNFLGVERAVTRETDTSSPFFELSVLLIKDVIEASLRLRLEPFIGEPNTEQKRNTMQSVVINVLEDFLGRNIITQYTSEVLPGTSPDTVVVNIEALPVFPINFIRITLVI